MFGDLSDPERGQRGGDGREAQGGEGKRSPATLPISDPAGYFQLLSFLGGQVLRHCELQNHRLEVPGAGSSLKRGVTRG